MFNHNKAKQSNNRVHISWDILYVSVDYPITGSGNVLRIICGCSILSNASLLLIRPLG